MHLLFYYVAKMNINGYVAPIKKERLISMAKNANSRYQHTFNSFAGTDIVAVVALKGKKPKVLGELQTISYSTFRPTAPVFALGQIGAKGVVRGARTIAGSLIFTVFDRHVLYEVMQEIRAEQKINRYLKADEIPGFDVVINFLNEAGESAQVTIYGVHLISEGQTMSIEDMITESTMEYVAMDIDVMSPNSVKENWEEV